MRGIICCIALTFSLSAQAMITHSKNHFPESLNQALKVTVNQLRHQYKLPALSVSIDLPGVAPQFYTAGYYTLNERRPISTNTLFQIGSLTKTYFATLTMQLVAKNKLRLNEKLATLLPQYPRWKEVTVNELLHHTSGVFDYIDTKNFWQNFKLHPHKQWTAKALIQLAYQHPDLFKPGQGYHYTDTDYVLIGMIIQHVTKQSPTAVLNEQLLTPFSLKETYYAGRGYPSGVKKWLAHGYDNEGTFGFNKDITNNSLSFALTAGAMVASPRAVSQFVSLLFTNKILNASFLNEMKQGVGTNGKPIANIPAWIKQHNLDKQPWTQVIQGIGFGLVYIRGIGFVWMHSGGVTGYQSSYQFNPCTGSIITLMYSSQPKQNFIFLKIYTEIAEVLKQSQFTSQQIKHYQDRHTTPIFCHIKADKQH